MTTIYIVRHGETDWNVEGRIQGHSDIPLNSKGEEQAAKRQADLKDIHFDAVFSSDLLRAKRTAELIALERNLAITTANALRERTFGELEGRYSKELEQHFEEYGRLTDQARLIHKLAPSAESDEEIIARFTSFLQELAVGYPEKTLLVTTHGAIMRTFIAHTGYASFQQLWDGKIGNTAYIKLETDGTEFFIKETEGITVGQQAQ